MAYDQNTIRILYQKLLNFYPRGFRERLGESMQQTFNDLYNERKQQTNSELFVLNLQPMLKREGSEGKRRLHTINLIAGAIILLLIAVTWGALLVEEIYCLRGIRCD